MADGYVPSDPVKVGATVPINIRDGEPLCPCCQEPMVEVRPGGWMCQVGALLYGDITKQLRQQILSATSSSQAARNRR